MGRGGGVGQVGRGGQVGRVGRVDQRCKLPGLSDLTTYPTSPDFPDLPDLPDFPDFPDLPDLFDRVFVACHAALLLVAVGSSSASDLVRLLAWASLLAGPPKRNTASGSGDRCGRLIDVWRRKPHARIRANFPCSRFVRRLFFR